MNLVIKRYWVSTAHIKFAADKLVEHEFWRELGALVHVRLKQWQPYQRSAVTPSQLTALGDLNRNVGAPVSPLQELAFTTATLLLCRLYSIKQQAGAHQDYGLGKFRYATVT